MRMKVSINNPLPNPPPSKGEGTISSFPSKGGGMKRNVSRRKSVGRAKALRRTLTEVEKILWHHLRAKRFSGYKFRRQYPVGPYIADFASVQARLIIELDGSQHAWRCNDDKKRDTFLRREGFRILRFWNNEVHDNLEAVLQTIYDALSSSLSLKEKSGFTKIPSPFEGRGQPAKRAGEG